MSTEQTERVLKEAVHMFTETIEPTDQWEQIERELVRRRRRTWVTPTVLALSAVAVVVMVLVGVGAVQDEASVRTPAGPGGDGKGTGVAAAAPPPPATTVAVLDDGSVVELSTTDGAVARTIAPADSYPFATSVAASADLVVVGSDVDAVPGRLDVIDRAAGEPRETLVGAAAAFSADGAVLVYEEFREDASPDGYRTLLVWRDLTADHLDQLAVDWPDDPWETICGLAVSPDGTRIAVHTCYEGSASHVLDMTADDPFGTRVTVQGDFAALRFLDDGTLFGAVACCYPEHTTRRGTVVVDPATGKEIREVTGGLASDVGFVSADGTAANVLLSGAKQCRPDELDASETCTVSLLRWSRARGVETIAAGVLTATW